MPQAASYFWILTLSWAPTQGGLRSATRSGIATIPPGTTREGAFNEIMTAIKGSLGPEAANATVVFFSLEPNQLG